MKKLFILISIHLTLSFTSLHAQNFIRGYSNLPFSGPLGFLLPQSCIQIPDGRYIMTAYSGIILVTNQEGEPISTYNLSKTEGAITGVINEQKLVYAGNNEIYDGTIISDDSLLILKISLNSGIIWQRGFNLSGNTILDLKTTSDGSVILLSSSDRGNTQSAIPCLTKISSDGSLVWQKRYFNSNTSNGRMLWENLSVSENGDLLISGLSLESSPIKPHFIRLSSQGELIWSKVFTPINNIDVRGKGLSEMENGELRFAIAAPSNGNQMATGKLSANGIFLSGKTWSQMGQTLTNCSFLPSGGVLASLANSEKTVFINENDELIFAKNYTLPGNGVILMNNAFPTISNGIAHFGGYSESLFGDFILTLITTSFTGETATGYSSTFNVIGETYSPTLDNHTVVDSIGPGIYPGNLFYIPTELCFDTLYAENPLALKNQEHTLDFLVFPNPAKDIFTVKTSNTKGHFEIYNYSGVLIDVIPSTGFETKINSTLWPKGNYSIIWKSINEILQTRTIIKQ
jgi:hypothetical protein